MNPETKAKAKAISAEITRRKMLISEYAEEKGINPRQIVSLLSKARKAGVKVRPGHIDREIIAERRMKLWSKAAANSSSISEVAEKMGTTYITAKKALLRYKLKPGKPAPKPEPKPKPKPKPASRPKPRATKPRATRPTRTPRAPRAPRPQVNPEERLNANIQAAVERRSEFSDPRPEYRTSVYVADVAQRPIRLVEIARRSLGLPVLMTPAQADALREALC